MFASLVFAELSGWEQFWLIIFITLFALGYWMRKAVAAAKSAASATINSPLGAAAAKGTASYLLGRWFR